MTYETFLDEINTMVDSSQDVSFPIVPHDYRGAIDSNQYIKFMVVVSKTSRTSYKSGRVVPGMILLSIFYPSGHGQLVAARKSDSLLGTFEDKNPIPGLQTDLASLQFMGRDPDNPALSRADLTIPFNYYGD
jgi:hypothetical protein